MIADEALVKRQLYERHGFTPYILSPIGALLCEDEIILLLFCGAADEVVSNGIDYGVRSWNPNWSLRRKENDNPQRDDSSCAFDQENVRGAGTLVELFRSELPFLTHKY